MLKLRTLAFAAVALLGIGAGFAVAQTIVMPTVTNVGPQDLFQDVVRGVPNAQNQYASAGLISAVEKYTWGGTITTDPAFTFPNGTVLYSAHKASTLTTGTFTTEPNPTDGKRECVLIDQTTSTLTWTANTGQTVDSSVRASGVASVPTCILYDAATANWVQSN